MITLNLNINSEQFNFSPFSGFTYKAILSISNYIQPAAYSSDFEFSKNKVKRNITAVTVSDVIYSLKSTLDNCLNDNESFYYDYDNQELYIHFDFKNKPESSIIKALKASIYADVFYIDDTNEAHLPLLNSSIKISKKIDFLEYNKMSFSKQTVELNNLAGDFDSFFIDPVPSSLATISFAEKITDTPKQIYSGIVTADSITTEKFKLTLGDRRESQSVVVPRDFISSIDYPNIDENEDNSLLLTGYGACRGIPAICTNGIVKTGNVEYVFSDFSTSISKIYVNNDDYWTEVTAVSTANGSFILSDTDARSDTGDPKDAKIDAVLIDLNNPADIIRDLNEKYLDIAFDTDEYDLTEWATEKALLKDVSLLLNEEKDIFHYFERLQNGSQKGFIYDILGDGRRTVRVDDEDRAVAKTIQEVQLLNKSKPTTRLFSEYASEINVKYNKDYSTEVFKSVIDRTYEKQALKMYTNKKRLTTECLLLNETDVLIKAEIIANVKKQVKSEFTIEISEDYQYDLKLFDFLDVDFGYIGQRVNNSGDISYINDRFYVGNQICKIIGYKYDLKKNTVLFNLIQK